MRVIVTGSRKWADKRAVFSSLEKLLRTSGPFVLVHGACATGADAMAEEWYQLIRVRKPAPWAELGDAAGPARNRQMIKDGADLVLAFPLLGGSGTQHTMRLAREAGIEVLEPAKE